MSQQDGSFVPPSFTKVDFLKKIFSLFYFPYLYLELNSGKQINK